MKRTVLKLTSLTLLIVVLFIVFNRRSEAARTRAAQPAQEKTVEQTRKNIKVLTGLPELLAVRPDVSEGIAVWAHVGGFTAGALLIRLFADPELVRARRSRRIERRRPLWRSR